MVMHYFSDLGLIIYCPIITIQGEDDMDKMDKYVSIDVNILTRLYPTKQF